MSRSGLRLLLASVACSAVAAAASPGFDHDPANYLGRAAPTVNLENFSIAACGRNVGPSCASRRLPLDQHLERPALWQAAMVTPPTSRPSVTR